MTFKKLVRRWVGVLVCAGAIACGDDDPPVGRLLEETPYDLTEEEARLQKMQNITVTATVGGVLVSEEWVLTANSPSYSFVRTMTLVAGQNNSSCPAPNTCEYHSCWARRYLEFAQKSLSLAVDQKVWTGSKIVDAPIQVAGPTTIPNGTTISIQPQGTASNVVFARHAAHAAAWALDWSGRTLNNESYSQATVQGPCTTPSYVADAALHFVEAKELLAKAAETAARLEVSVADSQLSSSTETRLAQQRAVSGPVLSRASAAHFLVGGSAGIEGNVTTPFCTAPEFSAGVMKAIDLIREAAPPPSRILALAGALSTDASGSSAGALADFVNGSTTEGSLLQRIEAFRGMQLDTVESSLGVSESDIASAVRYLADEIIAFGRSQAKVVAGTYTFPKYAATAHPPSYPDAVYWSALSRTDHKLGMTAGTTLVGGTHRVTGKGTLSRSSFYELGNGVFGYAYRANAEAAAYLSSWLSQARFAPGSTLGDATRSRFVRALSEAGDDGVLTHCSVSSTSDEFWVKSLRSDYADSGLFLVKGEDGLACAVQGKIDGEDCASELPSLLWQPFVAQQPFVATDFPGYVKATRAVGNLNDVGLKRLYVVRRKGTQSTPGAFESVVGFFPYRGSNGTCVSYPIARDADVRVAKLLEPSNKWCTQSSVSCAGTRFDERLPLENELAQTEDGIESSWRYYLNQAKAAAEKSDALAQEYLNAGLQKDLRIEGTELQQQAQREKAAAELETLQSICGTAVDTKTILDAIGDGSTLTGSCAATDSLDPGIVCISGKQVRVWDKTATASRNPELRKLMDCVSRFSATNTVHLGTGSLCYWVRDASGLACDGTPTGYSSGDCPSLKTGSSCPNYGQGYSFGEVSSGLGWFDSEASLPPEVEPTLCDSVRTLRRNDAGSPKKSTSALRELRESGVFDPLRLANVRGSLAFRAKYGGYAELAYGGKAFASTGSVSSGATVGRWPCNGTSSNPSPLPSGCSASIGGRSPDDFFCTTFDCSTPNGRAEANDRMMNAAIAFEIMTYGALEANFDANYVQFELPYLISQNMKPAEASRSPYFVQGVGLIEEAGSVVKRYLAPDLPPSHLANFVYRTRGNDFQIDQGNNWIGFVSRAGGVVRPKFDYRYFFRSLYQPVGTIEQARAFGGYFLLRAYGETHKGALVNSADVSDAALSILGGQTYVDSEVSCSGWPLTECFYTSCIGREDLDLVGTSYEACAGEGVRGTPIVPAFPLVSGVGEGALYDALELACEVQAGNLALGSSCGGAPVVQEVGDLERVSRYLECRGAEAAKYGGRLILQGVPGEVVGDIQGGKPAAPVQGQLGQATSELRSALRVIGESGGEWNRLFREWATELRRLKSQLRVKELEDAVEDRGLASTIANQVTSCVTAVAQGMSPVQLMVSLGGSGIAAAATCGNAVFQSVIANDIANLKSLIRNEERVQLLADMEKQFIRLQDKMAAMALAMNDQAERVQRALGTIEDYRDQARRAMDRALWHSSFVPEKAVAINNVMQANELTARNRYVQAHQSAQKMAFLARRAIEQRLGVDLASLRDDLPLVDAPQTWVSNVCATSPVDYASIAGSGQSYADAFIGDYVDKLEAVVESYRLQYGFKEGVDTVVASLRDDIANVREECLVEGENLLYAAADFGGADGRKLSSSLWYVDGCPVPSDTAPFCLSTSPDGSPFSSLDVVNARVPGVRVTAWNATNCPAGMSCVSVATWPSPSIKQDVLVAPGRYRYSWYQRPSNGSAVTTATSNVGRVWVNGVVPTYAAAESGVKLRTGGEWARHYKVFEVTSETTISVGFAPLVESNAVWVAAPMLERVDPSVPVAERLPRPFVPTTATSLQVARPECEDSDGSVFRTRWTRFCEMLCPDGYGTGCGGAAKEACYREFSFHVGQSSIEAGRSFVQSGFARGNFNYRIENIALNFVGTGIRNCEDSNLPTSCYGGGFVPYSLYHRGPFFVRNHFGDDFQASLFPGVVEHARGLATEQYVSNPISSSAASMLADYTRLEFQGRPLDGQFAVRVWEEPGVAFDSIEDIQVIMKYRYWTRTQ